MSLGIFIAGRLSSERLPNKLILPIGDSSLWEMACEKLNQVAFYYDCFVLAEEGILCEIASRYNNLKIVVRDKNTAKVDSPLSYIFKDLEGIEKDHLMFLNPCLSFLSAESIIKYADNFVNERMSYATSVKPYKNWLFDRNNEPLLPIDYEVLSTKDIEPMHQAAHCFHIFDKNEFFKTGKMLVDGHGLIEVKEEETIDVDTLMDYKYVRWLHENSF